MQEEVEQKTVNLAVTTTKLTGRVAVKAIAWYLRHRKEKKLEKDFQPSQLRLEDI